MPLRFTLNGAPVEVPDGTSPSTTLLNFLRAGGRTGAKEGCAEGDCGACTVAVLDADAAGGPAWRAVCSCILLLPQVDGRELRTVEGLAAPGGALHPAQEAMVEALGSQCGYCTPGFVMNLFEATYRRDLDQPGALDDQLCGNLCRCTGYRPIQDALRAVAGSCPLDAFSAAAAARRPGPPGAAVHEGQGQRWVRPDRWELLWDEIAAHGPPRFLHGATDLGVDVTQRGAAWPFVVDLSALPDLADMRDLPDGAHHIGAGARLSDLEAWSAGRLPAVHRMLRFFASRQIKNRGTVGGNLCNASPIGDLAPALLALDAVALVRGPGGDRELPLSAFFTGYRRTALGPGELLLGLRVPAPPAGARQLAAKVCKRRELDISAVAAGMVVATDPIRRVVHARLAFGGMAATPARAHEAEAALLGRTWGPDAVEDAVAALSRDFAPIDDHRASAWYRATVAGNLLRGFYEETLTVQAPILGEKPVGAVVPGGRA